MEDGAPIEAVEKEELSKIWLEQDFMRGGPGQPPFVIKKAFKGRSSLSLNKEL